MDEDCKLLIFIYTTAIVIGAAFILTLRMLALYDW